MFVRLSHTFVQKMKLNSAVFHSIFTPELKKLAAIFTNYGYDLRLVGGAVRDILDGKKPYDLDFATSATPDQMKKIFEKENIRMLNTNGEKHGTITARINDRENFEITTLRMDISTDGRHAEVKYTTDWKIDAARRDLTVNSMYLSLDGTLHDYFNGYENLKDRKILFVGDTELRIKEDYLRILRYFRFFGRITNDPNMHDNSALKAIKNNASGLSLISGERIWSELSRILSGNYAEEILKKMLDLGLAPFIGLPEKDDLDIESFEKICQLRSRYDFNPISYIAVLLKDENQIMRFHSRVKLSSYERDLALFLINSKLESKISLKYYQDLIVCKKEKLSYIIEFLKFKEEEDLIKKLESWEIPVFPINGHTLRSYGIKNGKQIGFILNKMKKIWVKSDFQLNKEDLLVKLPDITAKLKNEVS